MESTITKNAGKSITIMIPMPPGRYGIVCIAQWSASVASFEATRCRHQRGPTLYCPGGRHGRQFQMKPKNTKKTQLLPSFLMVDQCKKAKQFWDPKQTLYSHHRWDKGQAGYKCETALFETKSSATF